VRTKEQLLGANVMSGNKAATSWFNHSQKNFTIQLFASSQVKITIQLAATQIRSSTLPFFFQLHEPQPLCKFSQHESQQLHNPVFKPLVWNNSTWFCSISLINSAFSSYHVVMSENKGSNFLVQTPPEQLFNSVFCKLTSENNFTACCTININQINYTSLLSTS
jgi:hypothetical protein